LSNKKERERNRKKREAMYINIIYKNFIARFFFKPSKIVVIYKGYFLQIIRDIYNTVNNWSSDISNKVKTKVQYLVKIKLQYLAYIYIWQLFSIADNSIDG